MNKLLNYLKLHLALSHLSISVTPVVLRAAEQYVSKVLWCRCRFLILLVESWRIVIISGTVHWFWLKTSFHPLLWTSSGLTGSWKLSAYIRFGSLRSVKSVKTRGNWNLRSVESVKPNGNWKPTHFKLLRLPITIRFNTFNTSLGSNYP